MECRISGDQKGVRFVCRPRAFALNSERIIRSPLSASSPWHYDSPGGHSIHGKTLRRSGRSARDLGPLHIVSAWATEHHLSLGQVAVTEKSNEIPAIPKLLELLDLHGAFVTIDAMGCQRDIAEKILEGG